MSADSGAVVDEAPPRDAASVEALARYARRMRPLRTLYRTALSIAAVLIALIVAVAYNRGEISHVTLRTVPSGPASLPRHTPAAKLTTAWTNTDTTAIGTPYYRGTVVTHDRHTVRGRGARTGRPTWSYTRTDRAVCTAIQVDGVTIAVYKLHGNCDELTALDSGTGARKWTRTLDKDSAELNGPVTYSVRSDNVMFVSRSAIYSISPSGDNQGGGGLDHWTFHHLGCTINSAVLGDAGALISQTCAHEDCGDSKFCGNGTQLLLRDGTAGYDDNSKTNKNDPDRIIWNKLGNRLLPTLAGRQVAARDPSGATLQLLDAKTGRPGARLALSGGSGSSAPAAVTSPGDADLLWIGGRTYALPSGQSGFAWQARTPSGPTAVGPNGDPAASLSAAVLAVPSSSGIAMLDPASGKPTRRFAVGVPPAGSLVYPLGSGFLVAGPATTVYR